MELKSESANLLKCSQCEWYLSCGPVYIQIQDGEALCGRCTANIPKKDNMIRNKQYEAAAKYLLFPCKYENFGCNMKLEFSTDKEHQHEEICEYRERLCPLVIDSGQCEWLGTWRELLKHAKDEHLSKVFYNECKVSVDITKTSSENYLLKKFDVLFIFHLRIVKCNNIYYCVRYLGKSDRANNFKFSVNIKRGNEFINETGIVKPEGNLKIDEMSSLSVETNSIIKILGGDDHIFSTVTIDLLLPKITCLYCQHDGFESDVKEMCVPCKLKMRQCEYQDCTFCDISYKCDKHEIYFCMKKQYGLCLFCDEKHKSSNLFSHYLTHKDSVVYNNNSFSVKRNGMFQTAMHIITDYGRIVCLIDANLQFFTPFTSKELLNYECTISCSDPITFSEIIKPVLNSKCDWFFKLPCETSLNISISIKKK